MPFRISFAISILFLSHSFGILASPNTQTDDLQFVQGFLQGIGSGSVFDSIRPCINGSIIPVISLGIQDVQSENVTQVKTGLQFFAQAVQAIPNAAEACKADNANIKVLLKVIKAFQSPLLSVTFAGSDLIINYVDVTREISQAIAAYNAKNYTQLGFWIGETMDSAILQSPETSIADIEFVEGFFQGIGSDSVFDSIKPCINGSIMSVVSLGIEDVQSNNMTQVKTGFQLFAQAVQSIPNAANACQVSNVDVRVILSLIKGFENPILTVTGHVLVINNIDVTQDMTQAINAYETDSYTQLGFWIGKTMDSAIFGFAESHENVLVI